MWRLSSGGGFEVDLCWWFDILGWGQGSQARLTRGGFSAGSLVCSNRPPPRLTSGRSALLGAQSVIISWQREEVGRSKGKTIPEESGC